MITQTSGFDYPYGDYSAYQPGEMWTYSDKNPRQLCNALARVYGKDDYSDHYDDVVRKAYFDAIGMKGWSTSVNQDGIRFHFDLEDMGRLGLLVLARGQWDGKKIIPQWFVEQLEYKQTYGAKANYNGPDDGIISLSLKKFPEAPYGYMTWVNTDGDYYPGADKAWAWGAGAGGSYILWNHKFGIVFAGLGVNTKTTSDGIPHIIESCLVETQSQHTSIDSSQQKSGSKRYVVQVGNARLGSRIVSLPDNTKQLGEIGTVAKWNPIEIAFKGPDSIGDRNPNPFAIQLDVRFTSPSGKHYTVPGFYDGDGMGGIDGNVWKVRFSADETGEWTFQSQSEDRLLNGYSGSFQSTQKSDQAEGFYRWGRLEYTVTKENQIRYLKFRNGPYWLKAGCDDPENLLGNNTHYNTAAKRKAAIEYLSEKGINSFYIMTHNLDGDDNDVWPWLGNTSEEAKENSVEEVPF